MKETFELLGATVFADLEPQMYTEMLSMLDSGVIGEDYALRLLRQVQYFDDHKVEILGKYSGNAIVIAKEDIVFYGTTDQAFSWMGSNLQLAPMYLTEIPDEIPAVAASAELHVEVPEMTFARNEEMLR